MKRLKEQQDKLNELEFERQKLESELEKIKEAYKRKIEANYSNQAKISLVHRFKFEEAIFVICYLVSLVEGKEYTYHEKELPIKEYVSGNEKEDFGWCYISQKFYEHQSFRNKIKLQYICSDILAAEKEIDQAINDAHAMGCDIYDSQPLSKFYELLTKPAKNYVQISSYNGHSDFLSSMNGNIEFICNDEIEANLPITLININSKICDPNYMYIVDFMNYLAVMKLDKENYTLTLEEMMAYARDFAEEVKKQKQKKSDKSLKKVVIEI